MKEWRVVSVAVVVILAGALIGTCIVWAIRSVPPPTVAPPAPRPVGYLYVPGYGSAGFACLRATEPRWHFKSGGGYSLSHTRSRATARLANGATITLEGSWLWSPTPLAGWPGPKGDEQ